MRIVAKSVELPLYCLHGVSLQDRCSLCAECRAIECDGCASLQAARALAEVQANDMVLWCPSNHEHVNYVQAALRELARVIEE